MPKDYKFHYIGAGQLQVLKSTNYQYEGLLFKNGIPQSGTRHWVSDSTHVATIDENGLLTAIDNGQTTIHFWVDENVQKDSIVVEVVELEEIFIELEAMSSNNNDTLYLVEGEYEYIYTEAQDNRVGARNRFAYETYTYNNSDDNVGTIDNGIFYAKNVGQTKIVVRSVHDPSLSDSALIIVGEAPEITAIKDTVEISYLERQGVFEMTDLFENEMDALMTLKAVDHTSDLMNINMVDNSIKYSINFGIFGYEEVTFDIEIFGQTKEVTIVFNALEPAFFKNILFVNGGEFMNLDAPTQLMSYLPGSKTTVKLDQYIAGATSVQDMVVDGNYAFVSADYYITRYDVETGEAIDSVYTQDNSAVIADGQGTEGAGVNNKMALYENMLLATRQSSSSAPEDGYNVRIYNKGDLSLIKKIGVSDQATDVAVHNDTAYVMINGGFAGTTSSLAVIDLKTLTLNREIDLGEDGLGVMQMQVKDNKIYCIRLSDVIGSKYNSGIVIYDIATGSVTEYEYTAGIPYDSSPLSIEPYTGDTIFVKKDLGYVAFNTENNIFGTDIHFEIPSYYIQDLDHIGKGSVYDPEDERYYVAYAYWHGTGVGQIYNNEFDSIGYFDSVGASPEVIKVCKVFESNQAPVVNNPAGEYFYKDSANVDITLPVDLFTDYEDVYPAVYLHNPAANLWLNYDNKTGILTGKYNNPVTDSTTISIPLQGIDMQGAYAIDTLKITIFPGNPVIVENPITDVLVNEDANDTTIDISGVFTDPDDDDELINLSVVSNSNSSLLNATLDSKIITLSFNSNENGSAEIVVQGELNGYIATDTFNVTVTPGDDAPFVANGIADIYASQHSSDSIIDLSGVFSDIDNDDASITKSVKSNSNTAIVTASISGNDFTLSFIADATGEAEIVIEGVSNNKSAYDTVLVNVVADLAPVVANPIADIIVTENAADSVVTLENVFTDADDDDASITKSVKSNSNTAIVTASISGNDLTLSFIADATGEAEIVIEGVSNGKAVTDTFTVTITPVTGIENTTIAGVVFYPNPSNGIFRVKTESGDICSIKVFNVNGTLVYLNEHYASDNEIDISNQPVGQYFISIKIGNVIRTQLIIKK